MLFPREEHRRNGKVDLFPRREHLISRHPGRVRSAIARFHGDLQAIGAEISSLVAVQKSDACMLERFP